jgi:hypothetical protein
LSALSTPEPIAVTSLLLDKGSPLRFSSARTVLAIQVVDRASGHIERHVNCIVPKMINVCLHLEAGATGGCDERAIRNIPRPYFRAVSRCEGHIFGDVL